MIALLILGLISSVCTAPHDHGSWYPHHHEHHHDYHHEHDHEYHHDHNGPWHHYNHSQFDNNNYNHLIHLPPVVSQEGVVGNEYIITVPLSRFDKTEILVMAHEGSVSIKAYHKCLVGYNDRIYENSRILPTTVDSNGKWTYESGVLKIVFPLKGSVETQTVRVIGTGLTTALPITNNEGNYDIDERFSA